MQETELGADVLMCSCACIRIRSARVHRAESPFPDVQLAHVLVITLVLFLTASVVPLQMYLIY